jgi:hypothetical protein
MPNDKLIKTVIIARSGIYDYRAEELPNLGLEIKDAEEKKESYSVYRPALVLLQDKEKFSMLPLTNEHPDNLIDPNNFKKLTIGYTGENVNEEWNKEIGELVLKTKVALVDNQALNNYYTGVDEVSPGYTAKFKWQKGLTDKEEPYDIVMTQIENGNHLAMTSRARGGRVACIIDSAGGNDRMKFVSGLWRFVKKLKNGVKDSDMGSFRLLAEEIATKKDTLSDEELNQKIEQLKQMTADLPESDDKNILLKYLTDYGLIKSQDPEVSKMAAEKISSLYEKLDTESMKEGENTMNPPNMANAATSAAPPKPQDAEEGQEVSLKYVAEELGKLSQAILQSLGGAGQEMPSEDSEATNSPEENVPPMKTPTENPPPAEKIKDTDPVEKEKEEEKETNKSKVTDSKNYAKNNFNNVTMDSSLSGKESVYDFFNKTMKGGK